MKIKDKLKEMENIINEEFHNCYNKLISRLGNHVEIALKEGSQTDVIQFPRLASVNEKKRPKNKKQ